VLTLAIGTGSSSSGEGLGGCTVPGLGTLGSESAATPAFRQKQLGELWHAAAAVLSSAAAAAAAAASIAGYIDTITEFCVRLC
jgi:hypothetical protein